MAQEAEILSRLETVEAELAELRTLLAPTRQRAELVKQSKEQAKANAALQRRKVAWIRRQLEEQGVVYCQGGCGRHWYGLDAILYLDSHHDRARSLGRDDRPENIQYLCREQCHPAAEKPEAVAARKQEQLGMGGSGKLLKNRLSEEE